MIDPDGGKTTYTLDLKQRLTNLVNPKGQSTEFVYDALDRQIYKETTNGARCTTVYDAAGNTIEVLNVKSTGEVISSLTYTYDCAGNKQESTDASGCVTTWTYDDTYQLTGEQKSGWCGYLTTYVYDPVGNRLEKTDGGEVTAYSYDAANQLLTEASVCEGTTVYQYDNCGNRTLKNAPAGTTYYAWDALNRMVSAEPPGGAVSMTYNAEDQRVRKATVCDTTKFIWDFQRLLQETDDSDNTEKYYTTTIDEYGDLISERNEFDDTAYPQYDALGSAEALIDDSQSAFARTQYSAFGLMQGDLAGTPFAFVGKLQCYRDLETELYYNRGNYYDPPTGRWTRPDAVENANPLGNRYPYAANNPVNKIDPSGRNENKVIVVGGNWVEIINAGTRYESWRVLGPADRPQAAESDSEPLPLGAAAELLKQMEEEIALQIITEIELIELVEREYERQHPNVGRLLLGENFHPPTRIPRERTLTEQKLPALREALGIDVNGKLDEAD